MTEKTNLIKTGAERFATATDKATRRNAVALQDALTACVTDPEIARVLNSKAMEQALRALGAVID